MDYPELLVSAPSLFVSDSSLCNITIRDINVMNDTETPAKNVNQAGNQSDQYSDSQNARPLLLSTLDDLKQVLQVRLFPSPASTQTVKKREIL
jgi:hypothetical protein